MKTLTIISHTEHYRTHNGTIVGLGSTVTEINNLLDVFDEINHIAMLHSTRAPASALPYASNRINFIPIPAVGGSHIKDKIGIIKHAFKILSTVSKTLKKSEYYQFRAPTGIGVFIIPYLIFFSRKKGWFKYAGNWKQSNTPLSYRFQKWILKKQNRFVTINGKWDDQPKHCLTFENPCLTDEDIIQGKSIIASKTLVESKINFCFVGRIEAQKGIELLIEAFDELSKKEKDKIGKVHIVGEGNSKDDIVKMAKKVDLDFLFHSHLSRTDVQEIYKVSHALVLPSKSEGFPKVVAEAMNFGCIPIVSNVSGISDYVIHGKNGFLIDQVSVKTVRIQLENVLKLLPQQYEEMIHSSKINIERFTFGYYNERISSELLS